MVLRPVELDAATDPGPCQSHEGGLDDVVIVHEVALPHLVVGHLHAASQFGQNHHLQVLVLQIHSLVGLIHFLVGHTLDDGVGIDHAAAALIHPLLQEDGILLRCASLIRRDDHLLFPCFYHSAFAFFSGFGCKGKSFLPNIFLHFHRKNLDYLIFCFSKAASGVHLCKSDDARTAPRRCTPLVRRNIAAAQFYGKLTLVK